MSCKDECDVDEKVEHFLWKKFLNFDFRQVIGFLRICVVGEIEHENEYNKVC